MPVTRAPRAARARRAHRPARAARARAGGARRAGCAGRRRGAGGLLAAAEELGVDATIGLQAGDELVVLVAFRAHALALVARHGLAFALAGDLQAAAIDAF